MSEKAVATFLREFLTLDSRAKAKGYHGVSQRFGSEVSRWILSSKRTWVVRKGRRGGGSTTALQFLVTFALFGRWKVARGDTPVVVVMSHSLAAGRDLLRRASMLLTDLGIEHEATADRIAIPSRGVEFRNYAPNLVSFLGITAIAILLDELAHWRDTDTGANPSREILARLLPTMATVPEARLLLVSSPAGFDDVHAERVAFGDTDDQVVSIVPSWEGNPTLTEQGCRRDSADEASFRREYAAEPQEVKATRSFERAPVDHSVSPGIDRGQPCGKFVVACDMSSGTGGDSAVHLVAGWSIRDNGERVLVVVWIEEVRGKWALHKGAGEVLAAMANDAKRFGATDVHADQRESALMTTELPRHGLRVHIHSHQTHTKVTAVERLQLLLSEGRLALPQRNGNRARKQLLDYQETQSRTGLRRFAARNTKPGSDDIVSALLTLMMADAAGLLEGSPNARTPKAKYVRPRTMLKLQYADDGPSGLDTVTIGPDGRPYARGPRRSQFDGGGF